METMWPNWPAPPKRVKISYRNFSVVPLDPLTVAQHDADGMIRMADQTLLVRSDISPGYAVEVLVHEVMHGVWKTSGGFVAQTPTEEQIVTNMAIGFTQVLLDNPDLLQWIKEVGAQEVTGERSDE